ncbi:hypothetical protein [uncultured Rikenella sp.]|uniref:hypothetical protein n=1 Tax=uncultured Rikenella sp. TaxID=368003 RepID=UPI0026027652|nr:hypothetical protein [uncultured Rikenella sp.]
MEKQQYFTVVYSGPVGFIKPWFAGRDSKTYSQQFLTPSIIEGMRQKLQVGGILRHKLTYAGFSLQREQTHPRGWDQLTKKKLMVRPRSILDRGVLVNPKLVLAFASREDAECAVRQHICLCRNEDVLLPEPEIRVMDAVRFDELPGYELRFGKRGEAGMFPVGFDRFSPECEMRYGRIEITGNPVNTAVAGCE